MFVALPAIYGVAMSLLIERLLRSEPGAGRSWGWLFGLLPLVAFGAAGPLGLGLLLLMLGVWWIHRSVPDAASIWRSTTVVWIGRVALLAVTARSLVDPGRGHRPDPLVRIARRAHDGHRRATSTAHPAPPSRRGPGRDDVERGGREHCLPARDRSRDIYLAARARVDGLRGADLDRALYDERTLIKHLAMRRTLFVFPLRP